MDQPTDLADQVVENLRRALPSPSAVARRCSRLRLGPMTNRKLAKILTALVDGLSDDAHPEYAKGYLNCVTDVADAVAAQSRR